MRDRQAQTYYRSGVVLTCSGSVTAAKSPAFLPWATSTRPARCPDLKCFLKLLLPLECYDVSILGGSHSAQVMFQFEETAESSGHLRTLA